jgi:hypothetical protein
VGTAAQYLLVQFLKFFIVRFYDFFIHRDLPRLKTSFVASALICGAISAAALRPSEFVGAGTLLTSREINVNYLTFAPKGAICHARNDQFF